MSLNFGEIYFGEFNFGEFFDKVLYYVTSWFTMIIQIMKHFSVDIKHQYYWIWNKDYIKTIRVLVLLLIMI